MDERDYSFFFLLAAGCQASMRGVVLPPSSRIPPCAHVHTHMHLYHVTCTHMYSHVLTCTHMYSHVLTCTHMYSHVLTCTRVVCICMHTSQLTLFWRDSPIASFWCQISYCPTFFLLCPTFSRLQNVIF